jgi:hypothetical protein
MSEFSNHRKWREFVTAVHESVTYPCAVTYPKVIGALRSGRDWFNDGAARASSWLRVELAERLRERAPEDQLGGRTELGAD